MPTHLRNADAIADQDSIIDHKNVSKVFNQKSKKNGIEAGEETIQRHEQLDGNQDKSQEKKKKRLTTKWQVTSVKVTNVSKDGRKEEKGHHLEGDDRDSEEQMGPFQEFGGSARKKKSKGSQLKKGSGKNSPESSRQRKARK